MKLPNLKQFVSAVLKPSLWAIKMQYDYKVKEMKELTDRQTEYILELETQLAAQNERIASIAAEQVNYLSVAEYLKAHLYSSEQVSELDRRVRELNYITSALYDKYYELVADGGVEDTYVPSFDNPWIPGDYILTDDELEAKWRVEQGLDSDDLLTAPQDKALVEYIQDYREKHPGEAGSGEGGPDWSWHIPTDPDAPVDDEKDPSGSN